MPLNLSTEQHSYHLVLFAQNFVDDLSQFVDVAKEPSTLIPGFARDLNTEQNKKITMQSFNSSTRACSTYSIAIMNTMTVSKDKYLLVDVVSHP